MQQASEARLPQSDPLLVKMAAFKGGSSSVSVAVPHYAMTDQEIEAKFRRLAEPVMGQAAAGRALHALWQMEKMKSMQELLSLFVLES